MPTKKKAKKAEIYNPNELFRVIVFCKQGIAEFVTAWISEDRAFAIEDRISDYLNGKLDDEDSLTIRLPMAAMSSNSPNEAPYQFRNCELSLSNVYGYRLDSKLI